MTESQVLLRCSSTQCTTAACRVDYAARSLQVRGRHRDGAAYASLGAGWLLIDGIKERRFHIAWSVR